MIFCPYCATRFRFDPRLTPFDADPPDSLFADHNAVESRSKHLLARMKLGRDFVAGA